jgi:hypothetical protein
LNVRTEFKHQHYAHCESGVVTSLLSHQGLNLSEPMVFGLAGGLAFAYLPFIKINGMPLLSYRMYPRSIIGGVQRRLGVKFESKTYRNEDEAMADLERFIAAGQPVGLQTSAYWLPYFPPEMRFQFNMHNLVVFGKENGEFLISDPVADHVVRILPEDLKKARFAKGTLAPKGYLYYPTVVPQSVDLKKTIPAAIRKTVNMMLHAPLIFGLQGIFFMANRIENLQGRKDDRYIKLYLGHVVRMQEEIGTGGGGFRFMYAAFLQQAADVLKQETLRDASLKMTEAGDRWRQFALACAKAIRNREGEANLAQIAGLLRTCANAEKEVYLLLKKIDYL